MRDLVPFSFGNLNRWIPFTSAVARLIPCGCVGVRDSCKCRNSAGLVTRGCIQTAGIDSQADRHMANHIFLLTCLVLSIFLHCHYPNYYFAAAAGEYPLPAEKLLRQSERGGTRWTLESSIHDGSAWAGQWSFHRHSSCDRYIGNGTCGCTRTTEHLRGQRSDTRNAWLTLPSCSSFVRDLKVFFYVRFSRSSG
jgi:hypothetical protein